MKRILFTLLFVLPLVAVAQDATKLQAKAAAGDTKAMLELGWCYEAGHGVPVDSVKALEMFRRASDAGNMDARAQLSRYYLWYSAFNHDTAMAVRMAREAMDGGSDYGKARMAYYLQDGVGMSRNYGRAWKMLEEAAVSGNNAALRGLAFGYLYGDDSIDYDPEKALACIKRMDEHCSSMKFSLMAVYYASVKKDMKTAWKWLRKGEAADNQSAMVDMVRWTFMGWGCEEDEHAAMDMLNRLKAKYGEDNHTLMMMEFTIRLSAKDSTLRDKERCRQLMLAIGDAPGWTNYDELATSYIYGNFTEVDTALAEKYWRMGVAKDDSKSMVQLAILMLNRGDIQGAREWAEKAYAVQDDNAAAFLARCYLYGRFGEAPDQAKARKYYLESARRGNADDLVMAGKVSLWMGDTVGAMAHFDRAIAMGYVDAYVNKAYVYLNEGDTKPGMALLQKGAKAGSQMCLVALGDESSNREDYKKAEKYYAKAESAEGDYKLARLYLYGDLGEGSEADAAKGVGLLRRAMAGGSQEAAMLMAKCYMSGVGVEERPDSARIVYEELIKGGYEDALLQLAVYYDGLRDTASAMATLQRGVDMGNVMSMLTLGEKYIEGNYVAADTARGVELYHRAAAIEPEAYGVQVAMAEIYLLGLGTEKDTAAAMPYLRRAVANGSAWANAQMGDMYYYGRGGMAKDYDSAMFYYYTASQDDDPRGDYMMGVYQEGRGNYEGALSYYASAARNGNRDAYLEVIRALQNGKGTDANPEQAFRMAQEAVDEWQHPEAYMLLGYAYLNGLGCEADTAKAMEYTRIAAEGGSTQAMLNMAALYNAGVGVERDTVQTLRWYERAVEAGSVTAIRRMANSYREGSGVPQDLKRAAELYQMAVDRGNRDAMCRLGLMYEQGEGVTLNSRKAFNLYTRAADAGSAWGMRLLGYCYAQGTYVQEDMEQAAKWFLKSAENGDLQSCYIIGMLYSDGTGVKKNKKEAKKWLSLAAQYGHEAAAEALESL